MPLIKARPRPRGTRQQQGYGADWQRLRRFILARDPVCRDETGCAEPSTDADHIVSRRRGGTDATANLRGLCHRHHSSKTAREDGGFGHARER